MLYAILGDIHSNYDAFQAVLEALKKEKVDEVLSIGDVVGYAAEPSRCIETLRELATVIVAGNHDYAAVGMMDIDYFNPEAREAVLWTGAQLSEPEKQFLRGLPLVVDKDHITLVHGSLHRPEIFSYIRTFYDAEQCLRHLEKPVCFVGHSHVPVAILQNDTIRVEEGPEVDIKGVTKAIINVGSVGQPRDRNPRACYALYDTQRGLVRIKRVGYDIPSASEKIIKAGLPPFNAERLKWGI